MKSSIVDVPRKYTDEDLFGINKYQKALIKFINLTNTPLTIALQGEWGSGKTSLMNQMRWELCDKDGAPYFPVWVNTWQYSLMKTPSQAIISILEGCIAQIGTLNPSQHKWEESKKKIGGIFKKMATVGTKMAASTVGIDGGTVDELFSVEASSESEILQLKNEIAKLIDEALDVNKSKLGFTFYIDDLDRIDPPVAVEILELLKNIFDLDKCVFILAIDYDVVIKGLKSKFGELTDKNEREFRAFFDKIIQLPFSMPVASYSVDTFLVDALKKIEFFTEEELNNQQLAEDLSEVARLSVGCNPRSLKRLSNTLSLISIINSEVLESEIKENQNKLLNFALVCMQIAYPYIYNQLAEEPNFKQWSESIAARLRLRKLTVEEQESLDATEEFDEEWEKVLFRMCQKETHLSNRAFQVSGLLNKIATIINNDDQLGEIVEATIELSAVTNLKAFDSAPKKQQQRDTTKFSFEGKIYSKTPLALAVVTRYINDHNGVTLSELHDIFELSCFVKRGKRKNYIDLLDDAMEIVQRTGHKRHYIDSPITLADGTQIAVSNQWTIDWIQEFIVLARKLGYIIKAV